MLRVLDLASAGTAILPAQNAQRTSRVHSPAFHLPFYHTPPHHTTSWASLGECGSANRATVCASKFQFEARRSVALRRDGLSRHRVGVGEGGDPSAPAALRGCAEGSGDRGADPCRPPAGAQQLPGGNFLQPPQPPPARQRVQRATRPVPGTWPQSQVLLLQGEQRAQDRHEHQRAHR